MRLQSGPLLLGLMMFSVPTLAMAQAKPGSSLFDLEPGAPAPRSAPRPPPAPAPAIPPASPAPSPRPAAPQPAPRPAPAPAPAVTAPRPAPAPAVSAPRPAPVPATASPRSAPSSAPRPASEVPAAPSAMEAGPAGGVVSGGARSPALDGRWMDPGCVPVDASGAAGSNLFMRRLTEFSEGRRWRMEVGVFESGDCSDRSRMLAYQGSGQYRVQGPAAGVTNAWEVDMAADRWTATPVSRAGVMALFNGRCGVGDFEEGRSLDVARTGCRILGIRPAQRERPDAELMRVANGRLYFGARPPDLPSDLRPTALGSNGLVRQR